MYDGWGPTPLVLGAPPFCEMSLFWLMLNDEVVDEKVNTWCGDEDSRVASVRWVRSTWPNWRRSGFSLSTCITFDMIWERSFSLSSGSSSESSPSSASLDISGEATSVEL